MAEWGGFLVVFWALWAVDQLKVSRLNHLNLVGWGRRIRIGYGRICFAGAWPGHWRVLASDLPFSFSPAGITNRGAGQLARPAEGPAVAQVWRWEEIQAVASQQGWICVNGVRFCPDTGHLSAGKIRAIAAVPEPERCRQLEQLLAYWIRPAHLRRRAEVLIGRTALPAAFNGTLLVLLLVFTVYFARDVIPLPAAGVETITRALPLALGYALLLHVSGVILAWRASRRLKVFGQDGRGVSLFSALMLPPQALRLRSLVGTGFFPPQHPLSYLLAFRNTERGKHVFHVWGDLRWPVRVQNDPLLAREIAAWFRRELEQRLVPHLRAAGMAAEAVFARPLAESAACCRYCPRCGDQFIEAREQCPHGVTLLPLNEKSP